MAYFLGVDTGGTYTDAVIMDEAANLVLGKAKSLTTKSHQALRRPFGVVRSSVAKAWVSGVSPPRPV